MRAFGVLLTLALGSLLLGEAFCVLVPKHYDLHLITDSFKGFLNGSVTIQIHVENKTDVIQLAADPTVIIKSGSIVAENASSNGTPVNITKIEKTWPDGLIIRLNQKLVKNRTFLLHLKFEGIRTANTSRNHSVSLFNLTDAETNKTRKYFVVNLTQNGTNAAFPCFLNSPSAAYKATVKLTITRPKTFSLATISYASSYGTQSSDFWEYHEDAFLPTVPIHINSFALVATSDNNNTFRVSKEEKIKCVDRSLLFTVNREMFVCMIDYISSFFGTNMPGNGLTVLFVPYKSNISIKAFNFFTKYEHVLRTRDPTAPVTDLLHSLSHQWIQYSVHSINSNASTMIDSLKTFAANIIFPKLVERSNASKYGDFCNPILRNHYWLVFTEYKPISEISSCYLRHRNVLVLNMVKEILGEKLFTEGLADLLSKSNHNPIKDDDLWRHLTHIAMKYEAFDVPDFPQSVEEIVKPYLNSSLFSIPLLEFDFDFYGTFGGFIKQIPYAFVRTEYDNYVYSTKIGAPLWKLPIQLVLESDKFITQQKTFVWSKTRNRAIALTNFNQKEILLLNPTIRGPFIVKYRKNNWDMIFERFDTIPMKIRLQLLFDMHSLAHSTHYNYTEYFRYLLKLKPKQDNLPIWKFYVSLIKDVDKRLYGRPHQLAKELFAKQLNAVYTFVNVTESNNSFWLEDLRDEIDVYLCSHDLSSRNRKKEYENLLNNSKSLTENLPITECCGLKNITLDQWNVLANEYLKRFDNYTKIKKHCIIESFVRCLDNKQAIHKFLQMTFLDIGNTSFSLRKLQLDDWDFKNRLNSIISFPERAAVFFDFFTQQYEEIKRRYPQHFNVLLDYSMRNLQSDEEILQALTFLRQNEKFFISDEEKRINQENTRRLEDRLQASKTTYLEIENVLKEALNEPKKYLGY